MNHPNVGTASVKAQTSEAQALPVKCLAMCHSCNGRRGGWDSDGTTRGIRASEAGSSPSPLLDQDLRSLPIKR